MRFVRVGVGLAAVIASAFFLSKFPWHQALTTLLAARWWLLGCALVAKACAVVARADRISVMLEHDARVPRRRIVAYLFCGFAADNLLASTVGAGARTFLLVRHGGVGAPAAIGAIALEKYVDGVMMGLGIEVVVHRHLLPVPFGEAGYLAVFALGLAAMAAVVTIAHARAGTRFARWIDAGAAIFTSFRRTARTFAGTFTVWFFEAIVLTCTMEALGVRLGVPQIIALTTVGTLAFVIPGLPLGAGTFEAGLVFGLRSMGVEDGAALSAALLYHAVQVLPSTVVGVIVLQRLGIGLRGIRTAEKIVVKPITEAPLTP
jgi:uncharacterized membrane protein YbhN (UPF0104 family)